MLKKIVFKGAVANTYPAKRDKQTNYLRIMKTADLRKKDKKELGKNVQELRKKLSDLRFKFSSGKLKNVKEISNSKKEIARILTILNEHV